MNIIEKYILIFFINYILKKYKERKTYIPNYDHCKNFLQIYINKVHYYGNSIFNSKHIFKNNIYTFIKMNVNKKKRHETLENLVPLKKEILYGITKKYK